jgi:hypothetical protein
MDDIENNIGVTHFMCFVQQSMKTEPPHIHRDMVKSGTSGTTSSPTTFSAHRNGQVKRENPGLSP